MTKKKTEDLHNEARRRATKILSTLEAETLKSYIPSDTLQSTASSSSSSSPYIYQSWIRGSVNLEQESQKGEAGFLPDKTCQYFDQHGFLLFKNFASQSEEVDPMKDYMELLVNEQWHPDGEESNQNRNANTNKNDNEEKAEKGLAVFRTDQEQVKAQGSSDYFLDSAYKVHFFAEQDAVHPDGSLKEEYQTHKMAALNKSGHALHRFPSMKINNTQTTNPFHAYTTSQKIHKLVTNLGWKNPVVPQSMYIFKQSKIGGTVTSHQDSTFLYTTPKQSCLGLWLALDDATLTNGCLWVRPKSHWEPVRRKFARNADYFEKGDIHKPQMIFEPLHPSDHVSWEGALPGNETKDEIQNIPHLLQAGFIPIECKAGDLLVFNGTLDHLSLSNTSEHQRHTFQLHLVEGKSAGVTWSQRNWLQYPLGQEFLSLGEVS